MLSLTAVVAAVLTPSDRGLRAGGNGDAGDSAGSAARPHRRAVDQTELVPAQERERLPRGDHTANSFQCPSETTSTVPSTTCMAVSSSIAYAGTDMPAAHLSASAMEFSGKAS